MNDAFRATVKLGRDRLGQRRDLGDMHGASCCSQGTMKSLEQPEQNGGRSTNGVNNQSGGKFPCYACKQLRPAMHADPWLQLSCHSMTVRE